NIGVLRRAGLARRVVVAPDREFEIDARPSDAMAIALRAHAKIFAHSKVLEKSPDDDERPAPPAAIDPADREKWLEILENMDPEDFGKYKI
ncbi:MAG: bifunctional nuclease family protein, partial [Deltaproteobacteria bacterium]|nr:bifunctional nuclease family protein [Deltaproteobacteria bacterium]